MESLQPGAPEAPLFLDPSFEVIETRRVEGIDAALALHSLTNEPGLAHHSEVMRDGRRGAVEPGGDLAGRQLAAREQLDDATTRWIGERSEDLHAGEA